MYFIDVANAFQSKPIESTKKVRERLKWNDCVANMLFECDRKTWSFISFMQPKQATEYMDRVLNVLLMYMVFRE